MYRPNGVSELYNVEDDPRELINLWNAPSSQNVLRTMLMSLLQWFVLTSDITPLKEDPRGLPPAPSPPDVQN